MRKVDKLIIMNCRSKVSNKGNQKSGKLEKSKSIILIIHLDDQPTLFPYQVRRQEMRC